LTNIVLSENGVVGGSGVGVSGDLGWKKVLKKGQTTNSIWQKNVETYVTIWVIKLNVST